MELVALIVAIIIGALIVLEVRNRKWARDGLASLRREGFQAIAVCNFGDVKIAFDHNNRKIAFINFETRIPNPERLTGADYLRSTTTEPYANLKHLRIDRQHRDVGSNGYQVASLHFSFNSPNRLDGQLELNAAVSSPGSAELEKLASAWPAAHEVRVFGVPVPSQS